MSFLEQRVAELQAANANIIQRVRDKTAGRIGDLEEVIKQAGLNPAPLKKAVNEKNTELMKRARATGTKNQGGPYIPTNTPGLSDEEASLYKSLNDLTDVQTVVDHLPLDYPLRGADEQSRFGNRIDPFTGRLAFHAGIDLSGPTGSRVYCTAPGKVVSAGRDGAYGNSVDVVHEFGIMTRYSHLSQVLVSKGQLVQKGEVLGVQGSTGRSTGQHLHYEVRLNDKPVNPKPFLRAGQQYVSQE